MLPTLSSLIQVCKIQDTSDMGNVTMRGLVPRRLTPSTLIRSDTTDPFDEGNSRMASYLDASEWLIIGYLLLEN